MLFSKSLVSLKSDQHIQVELQDAVWFEKTLTDVINNTEYIYQADNSIFFQQGDSIYSLVIEDTMVSFYKNGNDIPLTFRIESSSTESLNDKLPVIGRIELVLRNGSILYPVLLKKTYSKKTIFRLENYEYILKE